jgi:ketosteroid isomerase-like protein
MSRDKNVALVRRRFEELDRGNFDVLDELFSPSYKLHPGGGAKPLSLDETKALYRYLYRAFPGLKHEISEQLVDGNKVVTVWSATGKGGEDERVTFGGINVYTIDDGKFVRSDVSWDLTAAMQPGGESVFEAARGGAR